MPQYGNEEEKTLTYDKIKIRLASPEKSVSGPEVR